MAIQKCGHGEVQGGGVILPRRAYFLKETLFIYNPRNSVWFFNVSHNLNFSLHNIVLLFEVVLVHEFSFVVLNSLMHLSTVLTCSRKYLHIILYFILNIIYACIL